MHASCGRNLTVADRVYVNAGCVILDAAPVRIRKGTMLGPRLQIHCADDANSREEVWIGGGAILPPGVIVGDEALIGADVPRDVSPGVRLAVSRARRF